MIPGIKKLAVFYGGTSREREVSLVSGESVASALEGCGYDVERIDTRAMDPAQMDFSAYSHAFIALHGRDGEDGKIQALLGYYGLPYTGSGVTASAVAMNKWFTKAIWSDAGIPTPPAYVVNREGLFAGTADIDFPVYVKPVNEGSSIGIEYVPDRESLAAAIERALAFDEVVLVEQAVEGGEYTYSYLHDIELPLIQLVPSVHFYDYDAKYVRDDTRYIVAPELSPETEARVRTLSNKALAALGVCGWGRVDFLIDTQGRPWFIEVNTVPGLTSHSLVPKAAAAVGLGFADVCEKILGACGHD